MSELISGKEALIALANGEEVEYWCENDPSIQKRWTLIKNLNEYKISYFLEDKPKFEFRLKPRTIKLNGIEVPEIEGIYILSNANNTVKLKCKTNEDALKVKEALRSIFNENN